MNNENFLYEERILDPGLRSLMNRQKLRTYQLDALRNIFDAAMSGRGGRFAVMFPRQSGKNETQAQLEAALMAANQHRGGNIIKIIPTEKNQGKISTERLASVLSGTRRRLSRTSYGEPSPDKDRQREGNVTPKGSEAPAPIRNQAEPAPYGAGYCRQREGDEASDGIGSLASRDSIRRNGAVSFGDGSPCEAPRYRCTCSSCWRS